MIFCMEGCIGINCFSNSYLIYFFKQDPAKTASDAHNWSDLFMSFLESVAWITIFVSHSNAGHWLPKVSFLGRSLIKFSGSRKLVLILLLSDF